MQVCQIVAHIHVPQDKRPQYDSHDRDESHDHYGCQEHVLRQVHSHGQSPSLDRAAIPLLHSAHLTVHLNATHLLIKKFDRVPATMPTIAANSGYSTKR